MLSFVITLTTIGVIPFLIPCVSQRVWFPFKAHGLGREIGRPGARGGDSAGRRGAGRGFQPPMAVRGLRGHHSPNERKEPKMEIHFPKRGASSRIRFFLGFMLSCSTFEISPLSHHSPVWGRIPWAIGDIRGQKSPSLLVYSDG